MKKIKAFALFKYKHQNLVVTDEKLPIYWYREVAEAEAIKYKAVVVEVEIIESGEEKEL